MTDDQFLDMVQKQSWSFFWRECYHNGLIGDQAHVNGSYYPGTESSIAAVGFGLTATCISHSRGWISYAIAYNRVWNTLNLFKTGGAAGTNGFYYHILDKNTGARLSSSELSSIDTAIFLAGVLFAGVYFKNTPIEAVADELYRKCNWTWLCDDQDFVSMSWKPENDGAYNTYPYSGGYRNINFWCSYDEGVLLDFLAIGSPEHPPNRSPACWTNMKYSVGSYGSYTGIRYATNWYNPLFLHQYPQLWVDLRKRTYKSFNYFTNSVKATLANKAYCQATYPAGDIWGLSSCLGPSGYKNYGALPWDQAAPNDGTIAPCAAGGSFMFTPVESMKALRAIYNNYPLAWGQYGFVDGFNVSSSFYSANVIGLDVGATMLSIENARTGMVWDIFMQVPYIQNALNVIGFEDSGDNVRPCQITDLHIENNNLTWTAPGDNGNIGAAASYEIRFRNKAIVSYADWYDSSVLPQTLIPSPAGTREKIELTFSNPGTYCFAIRATDAAGNRSILSSGSPAMAIGNVSSLSQNFPNPFYLSSQTSTRLRYTLGENGNVKLKLYSLSGSLVKEWDEGNQKASSYFVDWNGLNDRNVPVSSGLYSLFFLVNDKRIDMNKIVVLR